MGSKPGVRANDEAPALGESLWGGRTFEPIRALSRIGNSKCFAVLELTRRVDLNNSVPKAQDVALWKIFGDWNGCFMFVTYTHASRCRKTTPPPASPAAARAPRAAMPPRRRAA